MTLTSILPRLVKVCGMLASPFEGERAAAALLASRMLAEAGLTWEEVLRVPGAGSPLAQRFPPKPAHCHPWFENKRTPEQHPGLRFCFDHSAILSAAERDTLARINHRRSELTPRQAAVVQGLIRLINARMAARPGG